MAIRLSTVAEVAKIWLQAGVSVIPIRPDHSKAPLIKWTPLATKLPSLDDVSKWFDGTDAGLAVACGPVSGNLEMLELEGRAMDSVTLDQVMAELHAAGVAELWEALVGPDGYSETSPSGGLHLLYRVVGQEVPGNQKVARRHATNDELVANPRDRWKVLAETRGHGGYVIVAPTPGTCHETGEPWRLINGEYGRLPIISWQQRCLLHDAIKAALDEASTELVLSPHRPPEAGPRGMAPAFRGLPALEADPISPGDDFEARVDWNSELLLGGAGWQVSSTDRSGAREWVRPGKDRRSGISATTGRDAARDRLYVFSTSTDFEAEVPYTKFGAYAVLHHGGDHHAAAQELVRLGFGRRPEPVDMGEDIFRNSLRVEAPPELAAAPAQEPAEPPAPRYSLDDIGNARRLWDAAKGRYLYIYEQRCFYTFDGRRWATDFSGSLIRTMIQVTEDMSRDASTMGSEAYAKWAKRSRSRGAIEAAVALMADAAPGATVRTEDLDQQRHLLNVRNGVLDLNTFTLTPHDPGLMMTRLFAAAYSPDSPCEAWRAFMQDVLPDETMRRYVQRALGYSLLGDSDQRAMFLVYGPTGTGKSTMLETIRSVFGDYGATSPSATFRARRGDGPTNDLHGLRGKRFVTTSESDEAAKWDEETLKRLTGRDRLVTRELYQINQEWVPECAIWLATNFPPKFSVDDDAIWRRAKLIPMSVQFHKTPSGEIPDMSRRILVPESSGILNWLIEGLREYREIGLAEPADIGVRAAEHRVKSDVIASFLDDLEADGVLKFGEGLALPTRVLYEMYQRWCLSTGERRPFGSRLFIRRIEGVGRGLTYSRHNGHSLWLGLTRLENVSILGSMVGDADRTLVG